MNIKNRVLGLAHLLLFSLLFSTQCAALREQERKSWDSSEQSWKGKASVEGETTNTPFANIDESSQNLQMEPESSPEQQVVSEDNTTITTTDSIVVIVIQDTTTQDTRSKDTVQLQMPNTPDLANDSANYNTLFLGLISEAMWDELFPSRIGKGKNDPRTDFYSFTAFKEACSHFPKFLNEGNDTIRRRELASFLTHLAQETGYFRYLEQLTIARSYSVDHPVYTPVEGKEYHGRGPIQLSYNYNYAQFSQAYFNDMSVLLNAPELLATDSVISFASAIWFWMTPQSPKPSCHDAITGTWEPIGAELDAKRLPGFGLTLNIINAPQCGRESEHAQKRYDIYEKLCTYFNVEKGDNCDCIEQLPYGKKPS
ncbi:MAG: chitinase [Bacteroidales bacterium]